MREQLRAQMYKLVREFQNSGQTQGVFCKAHGIKLHKFQYWKKKYSQEQVSGAGFAELAIRPPVSSPEKLLVIRMSNGTIIEIPV